jgi:formylglycine-generating enzyme required for sulfatase activity
MKTQLLRFWLLSVLLWTPSALWAGQRVALVVGCGKYASLPGGQLVSPAADSADVAASLQRLGYAVVGGKELKDPSRDELTGAVERFAEAARGAEAAVFYFSGHGVQVGEDNYLLAVDTPRITGLAQLKNRALHLRDSVMVALEESGVATKVIVLDCCRDNPFSAQLESALAQVGKSIKTKSVGEITGYGPGFYLAFATSPGQTALDGNGGRNSPFTTAFLKSLEKGADKDIDLLFRDVKKLMPRDQVSWTNSSLEKEFSLSLVVLKKEGSEMRREASPEEAVVRVTEGKAAGDVYENGFGMRFRWCPAGEFLMGSSKAEQEMAKKWGDKWGYQAFDEVQHRVRLTSGYWMQEREVSQGDWRGVMGTGLREEIEGFLRSETRVDTGVGKMATVREFFGAKVGEDAGRYVGVEDDEYPMIYVDWEGAQAYCRELTEKEKRAGRLGEGWKYELPTEAQWEYACRAGSKEAVYGGEMKIFGRYNAPVLDRIAWYGGNSAVGYPGSGIFFKGKIVSSASWPQMAYAGGVSGPRMCGLKAGNGWGLKDMLGNVAEWCGDWYGNYPVNRGGLVPDRGGPASGDRRVFRGGTWFADAVGCRAAYRYMAVPAFRISEVGFRAALVPSGAGLNTGSASGQSRAREPVRAMVRAPGGQAEVPAPLGSATTTR